MAHTSLSIPFSDGEEVSDLRDLLIIEQKEWENTIGKVLMSDFYSFSYAFLMAQTLPNTVSCGLNADGSLTSIIYVFPRVQNLSYKLHTSFGTLSSRSTESYEQQELIIFNVAKKGSLSYSPSGSPAVTWLGSVYDSEGNVRSTPSVSIDSEGNILIPEKVFGTMKCVYQTERHMYRLSVTPRESGSDLFGAVVYGVYQDGISWLEMDNPPNVDELTNGTVDCGGLPSSSDSDGEDGDDDPDSGPTTASKVSKTITTDYCTQIVQSDTNDYT